MILSKDALELLTDCYECSVSLERLIQDSLLYYGKPIDGKSPDGHRGA